MLTPDREGFTLVEVIVALVILSVAVLGLAASTSRLTTASSTAELRALSLMSVEDVLARVRLEPRYGSLDSLYSGVETGVLGITGMTRTTDVVHVVQTQPDLDYTEVAVTVDGPMLLQPVSRRIVIGAP